MSYSKHSIEHKASIRKDLEWQPVRPASEWRKIIGKNIKDFRKTFFVSQHELAKRLGKKSSAYIQLIECGKRNISSYNLAEICEFFGVSPEEIFKENPNS